MIVGTRQIELQPDAAGHQAGGAPTEPKRLHRPKSAFCLMLSILWVFPSAGAALILGATEAQWLRADGLLAGLRAVTFEQWIAFVILLAHLVFAWLAWQFRRTEPWREVDPDPDPDPDLRKVP
jgi:hypothetical protein